MVNIAQIHAQTSVLLSAVFNLMGCKIADTKMMYNAPKLMEKKSSLNKLKQACHRDQL